MIATALPTLQRTYERRETPWRADPRHAELYALGLLDGYADLGGHRSWITPKGTALLFSAAVAFHVLTAAGDVVARAVALSAGSREVFDAA